VFFFNLKNKIKNFFNSNKRNSLKTNEKKYFLKNKKLKNLYKQHCENFEKYIVLLHYKKRKKMNKLQSKIFHDNISLNLRYFILHRLSKKPSRFLKKMKRIKYYYPKTLMSPRRSIFDFKYANLISYLKKGKSLLNKTFQDNIFLQERRNKLLNFFKKFNGDSD
jgi:hypothetical protein